MPSHIYKLGGTTAATLTIPPTEYLTLTTVSGTFKLDDVVSDTNGGHGKVIFWNPTTLILVVAKYTGTFTTDGLSNETDGVSTATITVVAAALSGVNITSSTPASVLTFAFDAVTYKLG